MNNSSDDKTRKALEALARLTPDERRDVFEKTVTAGSGSALQGYVGDALQKLDRRIEETEGLIEKLEDSKATVKNAGMSIGGTGLMLSAGMLFLGGVDVMLLGGAATAFIGGMAILDVRNENRKIKREQERLEKLNEEKKALISTLAPDHPALGASSPSAMLKLARSFDVSSTLEKPANDRGPQTKPPEQKKQP